MDAHGGRIAKLSANPDIEHIPNTSRPTDDAWTNDMVGSESAQSEDDQDTTIERILQWRARVAEEVAMMNT